MTVIFIGSMAAVQNHGIGLGRLPKDCDLFSDEHFAETPADKPGTDTFWDPRLSEWFEDDHRYATVDELYTIKHSHAYWELKNGSWNKHMADMLRLEDAGGRLIPELHDLLYRIWEDHHGKKQVDLNQDKTEFFTDGVKRRYDHDSIHYSVAYGDRPLYEDFLKAPPSVMVDMKKVWDADEKTIIQLFREEVYATALERIVIPQNYKTSPGAAYQWALRRTITSLTKGRSARFIVSNYRTFRKPDMDYVQHHRENSHKLIEIG